MAGLREPIGYGSEGTVKIGPFVSDVDGKTPITDLIITQADAQISHNNGPMEQKASSNVGIYDENGWYDIPLNTTDTQPAGHLVISVIKTGALPVWRKFAVDNPAP